MITILVTGSREYTNKDFVWATLDQYRLLVWPDPGQFQVIEGECPTGADLFAREWRTKYGIPGRSYPADWDRWGKAAGSIRNGEMVATGPDLCLAFPIKSRKCVGTWDCYEQAVSSNIKAVVCWPNKKKEIPSHDAFLF